MENLSNCGTFVKLSSKAIRKVLHDFADFDEKTRNLILKNKKNKFHQLKNKYKDVDNQILEQSVLIISIREYIQSIPQEKREMQKFMKKFTKQGKKERMLLERWPRIRKAILEDNISFRKLAIFLNEKYHLNINHSNINKIWNKIEGDL